MRSMIRSSRSLLGPDFRWTTKLSFVWALSCVTPTLACAQTNAYQAQQDTTKPQSPSDTVKRTPDVIFVPTPMEVVDQMLSVTQVGKNDTLYDLGSGDGRIVITAAKRFGTKGIGIDIDPQRIKESLQNADTAGVAKQVEFRQADLFKTDLRNATVVTLYLLPRLNVQLRPKLFTELRPGTRIVSHAFDMGDWKADSTIAVDSRTVYYWLIPANVAGTWTVQMSGNGNTNTYRVTLEQRFQTVKGTAMVNDKSVPLSDIRVSGDRIWFTIPNGKPMVFEGTVNGATMAGTTPMQWSATRAEKTAPVIAD